MKSRIITVCVLFILIIITTIFAINVNENKDSKLNIVTSFYPMYNAVLNITEGIQDIAVTNLTNNQGGCIHDYVLTTTELVTLAKADVLVINGAGMEGFMDKVISNFDEVKIIDSSEGIDIIHEECESEHEKHVGHTHEVNSHIFVSVKNYIKQVQNICEELVKVDNKNKELYEFNTKEYITKLQELDKEITEEVDSLRYKNIVTFHNTFDYFAKDYGLNVVGTVESEHGKTPSASELAILIENMKNNNVKAIFVEPEYSIKVVDTIAKETKVKIYTLNPITSGKNNKDEYINIMKENLNTLKEALN